MLFAFNAEDDLSDRIGFCQLFYLKSFPSKGLHFRKRERLMSIRFKAARYFVIIFDLVLMAVLLTKAPRIATAVYFLITLLEGILLLGYLLRLLCLMRRFHRHEYEIHKHSLFGYGLASVLSVFLREVWAFDFSRETKPEWF